MITIRSIDQRFTMTSICQSIRQSFGQALRFVKNYNLFKTNPPTTDEHKLRNQRISTRLFIVSFFIALIILLLYNSLITVIKTDKINAPSLADYKRLDTAYRSTLTCPCENLLIDYEDILHIDYTLHQVCKSSFVTQEWIEFMNHPSERILSTKDFRALAIYIFQALAGFCQLVDQTIADGLHQFYLNQYVSPIAVSSGLFQSQVQMFAQQFRSSMTNNFLLLLETIHDTSQFNALHSVQETNYILFVKDSPDTTWRAMSDPKHYSGCDCDVTSTCTEKASIDDHLNNRTLFFVPGIYRGCFIVGALRQSTLECFYNQTCLQKLQSYFNYYLPTRLVALNSSLESRYSINSTIKDMLSKLMIEEWDLTENYSTYYNECRPVECTYTSETRNSILYIITVLHGFIGGVATALALSVPTLVHLIRRKQRTQPTENATSYTQRIVIVCQKTVHHIRTLNLFQSVPPSTDEHILRNQRISTRLSIVFFFIALIILLLYNSLITVIKTDKINAPSLADYQRLDIAYHTTFTCPCENLLIDYEDILHIDYTFHQACTSFDVSGQWIDHLWRNCASMIHRHEDSRIIFLHISQALSGFCQLVNRTILESREQFYLNQYVSPFAVSSTLFKSQVQIFGQQFRSSMTNNFLRALDMIGNITQSNALYSAQETNYFLRDKSPSKEIFSSSQQYSNCSCNTSTKCIQQLAIYMNADNGRKMFLVPGMYEGCYFVEALLQSTLECFYDQSCLNALSTDWFFTWDNECPLMTVSPLNSSLESHYSINSTVKDMLGELMIEEWNLTEKYSTYYNECRPVECTYTYETRSGIMYIMTVLYGLAGGLVTILKVVVPRLVQFIQWTINVLRRRRQP